MARPRSTVVVSCAEPFNSPYDARIVHVANATVRTAAVIEPAPAHVRSSTKLIAPSIVKAAATANPGVRGDHHHSWLKTPCRAMATWRTPHARRIDAIVAL